MVNASKSFLGFIAFSSANLFVKKERPKGVSLSLIFTLLFFAFLTTQVQAQNIFPINQEVMLDAERELFRNGKNGHYSIRPFFTSDIEAVTNIDSLFFGKRKKAGWTSRSKNIFIRKIFRESLIVLDTGNLYVTIDPLMDLQLGNDYNNHERLYRNTRGFLIQGNITPKLYFKSSFYESQARFIDYVDAYVGKYLVAPGETNVKEFKEGGWDFGTSFGMLSYSPWKFLNVQVGHDKHFIGNGYRSLLLSDYGFQYPYLKVCLDYENFRYMHMWTSFSNPEFGGIFQYNRPWEEAYMKKTGSFSYLSWNPTDRLELGFFESIIFEIADSSGTHFDPNIVNPVIYWRSVQYSLNDGNNSIIGLNVSYLPLSSLQVYGQLMIDDFRFKHITTKGYFHNRTGFQLGAKWLDIPFVPGMIVQIEYNSVRPYSYGHRSPFQSYTHYNQALAHPLGANFREFFTRVHYRRNRFALDIKFSAASLGKDYGSHHWGSNIFRREDRASLLPDKTSNSIGQGLKTNIRNTSYQLSYIVNPKTNLQLFVGTMSRLSRNDNNNTISEQMVFGIRTGLINHYYDF